jgi:hypothetical protein
MNDYFEVYNPCTLSIGFRIPVSLCFGLVSLGFSLSLLLVRVNLRKVVSFFKHLH